MSAQMKNILVLFGGGSSEHEVSKISSKYIVENLKKVSAYNSIPVEITKEGHWECQGRKCSLNGRILKTPTEQPYIDYVIPCIHGAPGETGEIQSFLSQTDLPYLGVGPEASIHCFNKVTTKMWLDKLGIPTTPWLFVNKFSALDKKKLFDFFNDNGKDIFIKASNQGSSIGCFHVKEEKDILAKVEEALTYSDNVLIEKTIKARELEIAAFEYKEKLIISEPGEITCPQGFYSYEQKYSKNSHTKTNIKAKGVDKLLIEKMQDYSRQAFKALGLRHLSRIDFFYTEDQIYLNEINTFPGMTPISMFPQMLEGTGVEFKDFLKDVIENSI